VADLPVPRTSCATSAGSGCLLFSSTNLESVKTQFTELSRSVHVALANLDDVSGAL
jgi:hypothetical protein